MATADPLCSSCNKTATTKCPRCNCSWYCSKACKKVDSPIHKILCREYREFDLSSRPTTDHHLAIFFAPEKRKPELIWVNCPWKGDEHTGLWQCADSRPYLDAPLGMSQIQSNDVLKRPLTDTIRIDYRDTFLIDGSPPNLAVKSLCPRRSKLTDWRGPLLAYGLQGLGMPRSYIEPNKSRDLDLNDFRHIVDFLLSYGN
ncbi:SET domain and MYND-type zinc finger protein 6 [Lasiodiplodia hormozganensis]|uniref:SET domain and MYND-type zinc finger protein 6 n=1 Tax=Lasiodiplodia hormozganensis TaxID=869390 RepID=A0AA40CLA5_9PEZI|nr:SET domain and MYND-type zinc finger protein 6 [Lasiodiplodia hormozganensis]